MNRARLALRLNKLPAELDAAPLRDIMDLAAVMGADEKIASFHAAKQRASGRRKRK